MTASWQTMDEDGVARTPSSFVVRQQLAWPEIECTDALPLWTASARPELRPALEHAVLAGLYGMEARCDEALEIGLRIDLSKAGREPHALVAARARVRREYDAPRAIRDLGPYFGFVAAPPAGGDPRRAPLWITTLEGYGRCPWQAFLRRFLRVEGAPDALDALPSLNPLLVGKAVHGALEALVGGDRERLSEALEAGQPVAVPWPSASALDALAGEAAREALLEDGIDLPGFAAALASLARPYLEQAKLLVWEPSGGQLPVLGAELVGTFEVADLRGQPRVVHFRADLVEETKDGARLSDYKTGRPISEAARADTRRRHLQARIANGTTLQALAYRLGAGAGRAEGRYVFLRPGLEPEHAIVAVGAGDEALERTFRETLGTLLAGLDAGAFVPRLLESDGSKEPRTCQHCEVAEACVRGDSGLRRRLARWSARVATDPLDQVAHGLFQLGAEPEA